MELKELKDKLARIDSLTGPALVKIHNVLTDDSPVKKFRDKPTAVKRVRPLLEARIEQLEAKPTDEKSRGKNLDLNYNPQPEPFRKVPVREGSRRFRLFHALIQEQGATLEEIEELGPWTRKMAIEHVRLMWEHLGWGVVFDKKTGRVWLTEETREGVKKGGLFKNNRAAAKELGIL